MSHLRRCAMATAAACIVLAPACRLVLADDTLSLGAAGEVTAVPAELGPIGAVPLAEAVEGRAERETPSLLAPRVEFPISDATVLPGPYEGLAGSAPAMEEIPLDEIPLDEAKIIDLEAPQQDAIVTPAVEPMFSYRSTQSSTTWLPGNDDQFGIVSLENMAVLSTGRRSGMVTGWGFHFLDGPIRTEMPPRLYDFSVGYQRREWIRPNFGWDFAFRVGAFSDFEGSAKKGVRFPAHVVTYWRQNPALTWMLGIDYLDWDEISLLPVFGAVWIPSDGARFDLAFPRPRAAIRVMETCTWLYVGGELGGGTWAIERDKSVSDNATYSDVRLVFGIETRDDEMFSSALELGYVFARELSYRSGIGDYSPEDCLMIRLVGRY